MEFLCERGNMMKNIRIILLSMILLIISFNTVCAKWSYEFVVYNKNVYVITDKKVNGELIGSMLGQVTKYSDREGTYSGNFSNKYPKGTKYYEIIGSEVNKVIAVKEKNATFIEAQYKGEYPGSRYDIQGFLLYSSVLILSMILAWLLVRKKILKSQ
jgi:hypothetical protein